MGGGSWGPKPGGGRPGGSLSPARMDGWSTGLSRSAGGSHQQNTEKGLEHQARELGLSPEGAGEPWNGFEERRSVIRTVCPKCVSGYGEEVGPEWEDGWDAGPVGAGDAGKRGDQNAVKDGLFQR